MASQNLFIQNDSRICKEVRNALRNKQYIGVLGFIKQTTRSTCQLGQKQENARQVTHNNNLLDKDEFQLQYSGNKIKLKMLG